MKFCAHISRVSPLFSVRYMAVFAAFQTPFLLANARPSTRSALRTFRCALSNGKNEDGERLVRFRKESTEDPLSSFKKADVANGRISTPNERLLRELEDSISELGRPLEEATAPPAKSLADYSHVKPWAAFSGSVGAGIMALALWYILRTLVEAYNLHPMQSDFYVVQRLVAVVRTAVVGLLALASGISGVTSLGLLLLGGQVIYDSINKNTTRKLDDDYNSE